MGRRLLHVGLYIIAATMLGGCATNCNILSSSNSRTCDAMLLGGMVVAAPILGPAALFSDAASDAKSKRMAQEWKSSMQTRLADNDIEAIQACLYECDIIWKYQLDYDVRGQLQFEAAQRFLAGNWDQLKPEDHRSYQLLAHYALSWQPESTQENARSVLMPDHAMQSYALLKDPDVRTTLKKLFSSSRYTTLESAIYGMKFVIDTPADKVAADARFDQCPDLMAHVMPEEASVLRRIMTCSRAYPYYFQERMPEELRKKWDEDRRRAVQAGS